MVCARSGKGRGFALLSKDTHNGDAAAAREAGLSFARQFAGCQKRSPAKNQRRKTMSQLVKLVALPSSGGYVVTARNNEPISIDSSLSTLWAGE